MRTIARLYEEDVKALLAQTFKVEEDHVDIYVDADGRVITEIEVKDADIKEYDSK